MEIPGQLRYTKDHEWARDEGDGKVVVGITDYAQDALGDITFVELPKVGTAVAAGRPCGVVESVKTFSDIYAPVSGQVVAINSDLIDHENRVNTSPYSEGWLFTIEMNNPAELAALLDAAGYQALLDESAHH